MYKLPLFPLNTVLFPGTPIFLHIFEERYKLMIGKCIEQEQPFGVVMIDSGVEAYGRAEPCRIGCSAQIVQVEKLSDGRMNIAAVGGERFEIVSIDDTLPYLQGMVRSMPVERADAAESLQATHDLLRPRVIRYTDVLRGIVDIQVGKDDLPDDPVAMGYFAAWILQVPAEYKQNWLVINQATHLLETVCDAYRNEIALVKEMITHARTQDGQSPSELFSLN